MIGINYFLGYPTTRTSNTKNIGKILGKLYSSSKIALPIATSETGAHYDSPFCIRLHTVDRGASEFLKFNGLSHSMVGLVPVEVEGDGYCFFHSVSQFYFGNAVFYQLIRSLTRQELEEHADWYQHNDKMVVPFTDADVERCRRFLEPTLENRLSAEDYTDPHLACQILANVLRRPICLFCPPSAPTADGQPLNDEHHAGTYLPLRIDPAECFRHPMALSWSSQAHNHFVPLVRAAQGLVTKVPPLSQPRVYNTKNAHTEKLRYIIFTEEGDFTIGDETSLRDIPPTHLVWSIGDFMTIGRDDVDACSVVETFAANGLTEIDAKRAMIFGGTTDIDEVLGFHMEHVGSAQERAENFLLHLIEGLVDSAVEEIDMEVAKRGRECFEDISSLRNSTRALKFKSLVILCELLACVWGVGVVNFVNARPDDLGFDIEQLEVLMSGEVERAPVRPHLLVTTTIRAWRTCLDRVRERHGPPVEVALAVHWYLLFAWFSEYHYALKVGPDSLLELSWDAFNGKLTLSKQLLMKPMQSTMPSISRLVLALSLGHAVFSYPVELDPRDIAVGSPVTIQLGEEGSMKYRVVARPLLTAEAALSPVPAPTPAPTPALESPYSPTTPSVDGDDKEELKEALALSLGPTSATQSEESATTPSSVDGDDEEELQRALELSLLLMTATEAAREQLDLDFKFTPRSHNRWAQALNEESDRVLSPSDLEHMKHWLTSTRDKLPPSVTLRSTDTGRSLLSSTTSDKGSHRSSSAPAVFSHGSSARALSGKVSGSSTPVIIMRRSVSCPNEPLPGPLDPKPSVSAAEGVDETDIGGTSLARGRSISDEDGDFLAEIRSTLNRDILTADVSGTETP